MDERTVGPLLSVESWYVVNATGHPIYLTVNGQAFTVNPGRAAS